MIKRSDLLDLLAARRTDQVVVHTMGTCNYWPTVSSGERDFFVAGAMGFASSVALGVALALPEQEVWVLDGDGSLLMNLGTLITCVDSGVSRFTHFVLDNGMYELTGRVPVPGSHSDFVALARAAGYQAAYNIEELNELKPVLDDIAAQRVPAFVRVAVAPSEPEPSQGPVALAAAAEVARQLPSRLRAPA